MRRKRLLGYMQAFYTSGHSMPTPFCTTHYMNRFMDPLKLVKIAYTSKPHNVSDKDYARRYRMPDKKGINITGTVRPMTKKDVS